MDLVGAAIRLSGGVSPALRARLSLGREKRWGDFSLRLLEGLVDPGDVVLDIGARWGVYAWFLGRLVGPNGQVHAFEPNPQHFATLGRLERRINNLKVHQVALSKERGTTLLHVPIVDGKPVDALAALAPRGGIDTETTPVLTERLDSLQMAPMSFVKCDVEGHELAVFRGGEETLRNFRPHLLVEIEQRHHDDDIAETFRFLEQLDYAGFVVRDDGLRPLYEFDVERDQLRFLQPGGGVRGWTMPVDYLHDFLFVTPDTSVELLMASS
jgi:FkbM family methyltransferase